MLLKALNPTESLEKTYRLQAGNREQIDRFKTNFTKLLSLINERESEENVKSHLMNFLNEVYYKDAHLVAQKGKTDFVIHSGKDASTPAGVLFEVKRPANKGEMVTRQNLNTKAFHELLLYYFRERLDAQNSDIRYCVITNIYEWFIFDAALIDRLFFRDAHLMREYKAWATKQKVSTNNELFYTEIAKPFMAGLDEEITFTYFDLRAFQTIVTDADTENDKALLPLYKVLSPTHLLKLPTATDSNRLNPKFYSELLHLIGLEEVKEGGKKVIRRKEVGKRDEGSLLENAIIELDSSGKFYQLHDRSQYGATTDDQLFSVALELCITWINRILFLKLLESQLVKYHSGNKEYTFLNRETIPDFDELNKLFFRVLARKPVERQASIQTKFGRIPYLNSSLFEPTELENDSIGVNQLDNGLTLPILRNSVLSDNPAYRNTKEISTLSYLFAFLDAYDFASESRETIQEKNRTLINASVLGLIFEKINGYKDGSFYTPGFITEYMCRETIRKAVVQKFNDAKGWDCADFAALENKDLNRVEANNLINEIRICDPAVGSGHFLVSALNELIAVKSDLGVLQDETGKRLKDYTVSILNDELIVQDEDETPFQYVLQATGKPTAERQRVQKTLFHEKQTIIENCLFGVDINPNSVKICRLRLWIELLKNAYYTDESGFTELETLPNIDINIKQGNSLLSKFSLTEDLSDVFRKQKFTLKSYKDAVAAYKNAPNKEAKAELQRFINEIKSQFRETVYNRDPRRKKLAKLRGERILLDSELSIFDSVKDPKLIEFEKKRYDKLIEQTETDIADIENNALYRGSFEWRFEFPEVLDDKGDFIGFDAIIGNPPYIRIQELQNEIRIVDYYKRTFAGSQQGNYDIYILFIELGISISRQAGKLCYILPNKFMNANYGEPIRKIIAEKSYLESIVHFGHIQIFDDATTYTCLLSLTKQQHSTFTFQKVTDLKYWRVTHGQFTAIRSDTLTEKEWHVLEGAELSLYQKLFGQQSTLEEVTERIFQGLKTSADKIYIVEELSRQADKIKVFCPFDNKEYWLEDELLFTLIKGGEGKRFSILKTNRLILYPYSLIYSKLLTSAYIEQHLPLTWAYLNTHKLYLENRENGKMKGEKWFGYVYPKALEVIHKPKIFTPDIALRASFSYDTNGSKFFTGGAAGGYGIVPKPHINSLYLLALLNGSITTWAISKTSTQMRGGYFSFESRFIRSLPIKNLSEKEQAPFIKIVNQILTAKSADPTADTLVLETEIDRLVYALYGLTDEEIAIVEHCT